MQEADNQRAVRPLLRPAIRSSTCRRSIDELSSKRVLTTELAEGARFDELLTWPQDEKNLAAEAIYRFVFGSLYRLGAFNGDPHPGNYLFRAGRARDLPRLRAREAVHAGRDRDAGAACPRPSPCERDMKAFRDGRRGSGVPQGQHAVQRRTTARLLQALLGVRARRRADDDHARVVVGERAPLLRPDRRARRDHARRERAGRVRDPPTHQPRARRRARRAAGDVQLAAHRRGAVAVRRPRHRRRRSASWKRRGERVNLTRASGNVPGVSTSSGLRDLDLDTFFRPRSVAVIGASDAPGKPTAAMTRKIKQWADHFGATIHPVNPNRDEVYGLPCHASIDDVDGDIDLAVILAGNAVEALRVGPRQEAEVRGDLRGRLRRDRSRGRGAAGAARARSSTARTPACSDPTPTSTRSRRSATTCPASASRSSPSRATRAGRSSRPRTSASR